MSILLTNIKIKIFNSPFVLIFLIIIQIFAITTISLTYGIAINTFKNTNQQTSVNKMYDIVFNERMNVEEINERLAGLTAISGENFEQASIEGTVGNSTVCSIYCGTNTEYTSAHFTYQQMKNKERVACAKYETVGAKVGDTIKVGTEEYTVVFTDEGDDRGTAMYVDYIIPYNVVPFQLKAYRMTLILKQMADVKTDKMINEYISQNFDLKEYVPAKIIDAEIEQRQRLSAVCCSFVAIIIVLSLSYVYAFIVQKRKRQIGIMLMCGGESEKIINLFVLEMVIYTLIGSVFSVFFVKKGISAFDEIYSDFSQFYSPEIFLIIVISYILLTTLCLTSFIRPIVNGAAVDIKMEAV